MLRSWLELARISNLPTVWTNVLAGWLLAGGVWRWEPLMGLLVGGSLLYTAGMILNDAFDAEFDREHRAERPIPSGRISAGTAWIVGLAMLVTGAVACGIAGANVGLVLALVAAILAYDAYHKPWSGSVLIMGSCRVLLCLVAGSAAAGALAWHANQELVLKALALGGYIVGVSLAARAEGRQTRTPVWSRISNAVLLLLPAIISMACWSTDPERSHFFVFQGIFWLFVSFVWQMAGNPWRAQRGAVGWLLAGVAGVDAVAIAAHEPLVALAFATSVPLLRLWQRKIAAT